MSFVVQIRQSCHGVKALAGTSRSSSSIARTQSLSHDTRVETGAHPGRLPMERATGEAGLCDTADVEDEALGREDRDRRARKQ